VEPYSHTSCPRYLFLFLKGNLFSWGVVGYLDEISLEYDVISNYSIPVDFFNYTERRINPVIDAQVVFQFVTATQIKNDDDSWWYQYQFLFYCFYGNAHPNLVGQPILNTDVDVASENQRTLKLLSVQQRLNYYLRKGVDIVNSFQFRQLSLGVLGISMEDPTHSTTPFEDGPPTIPPTMLPTFEPNDDLLVNGTGTDTNTNGNSGGDIPSDGGDPNGDNVPLSSPTNNNNDNNSNNANSNNYYYDKNKRNPDGSFIESYRLYTSPVNVQLWVRTTTVVLLCVFCS
jgi:hypothetical protein